MQDPVTTQAGRWQYAGNNVVLSDRNEVMTVDEALHILQARGSRELTALRERLAAVTEERDTWEAHAHGADDQRSEAYNRWRTDKKALEARAEAAETALAAVEGITLLALNAFDYYERLRGFSNEDDDFWNDYEARFVDALSPERSPDA